MNAVNESAPARPVVTYAIGDVHGRLDLLQSLLALIEADASRRNARAKIVFCGDYVDRGPDSFGVVERLIQGPARAGDTFICLRGNHDGLFTQAVVTGEGLPDWAWALYGQTVRSYEPGGRAALNRHADFLKGLPLFHDDGQRLFVHAGIRPGVTIEAQSEEDLIWIREEFLDYAGSLPRLVVHGHTIMGNQPVVRPHRVSIDTGAYTSGILTAAVFDPVGLRFLQAIGTAVAWTG